MDKWDVWFAIFLIGIAFLVHDVYAFQMSRVDRNNIQASHVSFEYEFENGSIEMTNITRFAPHGVSMQPTYYTDNTLLTLAIDENFTVHEGDIVIVNGTCHRIRGIYPEFMITQGDNNLDFEQIRRDDITHVVVGVLYT